MISDAIIFAELGYSFVHFPEVVAWDHGEKVVINLVLQTTTKPVIEPVACDVPRGGNLQLPEIRSFISIISAHAIVPETKNKCKENAAQPVVQCSPHNCTKHSTGRISKTHRVEIPDVVKGEEEHFTFWELHKVAFLVGPNVTYG